MQLIIDLGNTLCKVSCFAGDKMKWEKSFAKISVKDLKKIFSENKIDAAILSSVINTKKEILSFLKTNTRFIELTSKTKIPVTNKYKTPETLGQDRLASVVGAAKLYPGKNILVIDIGTCVKYNFINSDKEFIGGGISPGLNMRFKALNEFTDKLPLVNVSSLKGFIGETTDESISSGVLRGMIYEMNGFIRLYRKQYKNLQVVLCGGDVAMFGFVLNFSTFAAPNLIPVGLNEILKHNVKKI